MTGVPDLLKLAEKREQGPSPGFGREHMILAFLNLGGSSPKGRQSLAASSGVGEGSIRTIIKKLKRAGYVRVDPAGVQLTDSGRRVYRSTLEKLTLPLVLGNTGLTVGRSQAAILARSSGAGVSSGIEQRDASIKAGAEGATSYLLRGDRFVVPGGSVDCERDFPSGAWAVLRERLRPRNGDAVVVCGARDETLAKLGALAAALTLL